MGGVGGRGRSPMCDLSDHQPKPTWMVSVEGEKQIEMSISNFKHLSRRNHVESQRSNTDGR